jgi:DNA repair exonuclease SbcCD ATPase subunit
VKLADAQKERERLKEVIARNEVFAAQVADLRKNLEEMKMNKVREESASGEQLQKLREEYQRITQEIKEADGILASSAAIHAHAENKKAVEELIESMTADLEHAADTVTAVQKTVTELEKAVQELKNALKMTGNDARISEIDRDISATEQKITGYDAQLAALDKRHPECTINGCSFIVAALTAQEALPAIQDWLEQLKIDRENRMAELTAAATELGGQIAEKESALKQARAQLKESQDLQATKRQDIAVKRRELAQYQNVAEKQAALAVAKSKKADREKALEDNKKQGVTASAEWTARKTVLDDQITKQTEKVNEIMACISGKANDDLSVIEHHIGIMVNQIATADIEVTDTGKKITALQSDLTRVETAEKELKTVKAQRESLVGKIARWRYLQIGCGKTGLQNLRIDGAAPGIIYNANKLLSQAYGARYAVRLETQNEDGKEDLQIKIIMENGQEVYLDDISGGQRAWNVQSLWLAMSLLNQEKSGRKYDYFCSDESDGALDVENAVKYTALYRPFMAEGKLDQLIFISHKPECRSMADHVLMFEAGKQPYWQ